MIGKLWSETANRRRKLLSKDIVARSNTFEVSIWVGLRWIYGREMFWQTHKIAVVLFDRWIGISSFVSSIWHQELILSKNVWFRIYDLISNNTFLITDEGYWWFYSNDSKLDFAERNSPNIMVKRQLDFQILKAIIIKILEKTHEEKGSIDICNVFIWKEF